VPWRLIVIASVEKLVSPSRSDLRRRAPRRGCIAKLSSSHPVAAVPGTQRFVEATPCVDEQLSNGSRVQTEIPGARAAPTAMVWAWRCRCRRLLARAEAIGDRDAVASLRSGGDAGGANLYDTRQLLLSVLSGEHREGPRTTHPCSLAAGDPEEVGCARESTTSRARFFALTTTLFSLRVGRRTVDSSRVHQR
jgi:hypothetical protein